MEKKDWLSKILAILGTVLVWLPILAPFFFSLIFFIRALRFRFDFLMPAELFPVALLGGALLFWAALRRRSHRGIIGWGLAVAAGLLIAGQGLAVVTGLASGETEPGGWQWALVITTLVVYILSLVTCGVGGILLLRDLFKRPNHV